MRRTRLAELEEIPEGGSLVVHTPDHTELVLFRTGDSVLAYDNCCPHEGGPIGDGEMKDGTVSCPWHGWQFDVNTGKCLSMPGEDLPKFPVSVIDGVVYLESE